MKKVIFLFTLLVVAFAGLTLTSCDSASKNAIDAKNDVKDAKQDLKEAQRDAAIAEEKAASAEEWETFRNETDRVIRNNEARIAEMKESMKKTGRKMDAAFQESIDRLEQKNKDMRTRMDAYENGQNGWESFKREFNHDMDELGKALSDLAVNNKN